MIRLRGPKFPQQHSMYNCPRCGDTYACETKDEIGMVKVHRLLHLAAEWKSSFQPSTYWVMDEGVPRPVLRL